MKTLLMAGLLLLSMNAIAGEKYDVYELIKKGDVQINYNDEGTAKDVFCSIKNRTPDECNTLNEFVIDYFKAHPKGQADLDQN